MVEGVAAIVLAGVHDWGACALGRAITRPLAPIANRAVVEHVLRALRQVGIKRAVVCANGHTPQLQRALGSGSCVGMDLTYVEDSMPRGPAGCVKDSAATLEADEFVVTEASILPNFDIEQLILGHRRSGACLTMATQQTERPLHGRTQAYLPSSDASHRPVGMYVLSSDVLPHISENGFQDIKEGTLPKLHAAGLRADIYPIEGTAPRLVGTASYFALNEWAVKKAMLGVWDLDGYVMCGDAMVHIDARIDPTARLLGPVLIGPGSVIEANAVVVGPTSIDADCIVGRGAVVSRSALWADAEVGRGVQIDRCVIARNAAVDDAAVLYNSVCLQGPAKASQRHRRVEPSVESSHPWAMDRQGKQARTERVPTMG